jgi:Tol biopolymer transport system component
MQISIPFYTTRQYSPDIDPALTPTIANINTNEGVTGRIVYTCQVNKENTSDQICVINADGSGQRQLTNSHDNQDASFAPDGETILFVSNRTGNYEIYEMDLFIMKALTDFKAD